MKRYAALMLALACIALIIQYISPWYAVPAYLVLANRVLRS